MASKCAFCRIQFAQGTSECRVLLPGEDLTLRDLRKAADRGCAFCKFRSEQLTAQESKTLREDLPLQAWIISIQWPGKEHFILKTLYQSLNFHVPLQKSIRLIPRLATLDSDHPSPHWITSTMDSTECWGLVEQWLRSCDENHARCQKRAKSKTNIFLPSRLIQVDHHARLVERDSLPSHTTYSTLSHCWGGSVPLTLTTHNQREFFDRIPMERLAVKFREAIHTTKMLGIGYLWIDSLCILQDSDEDWARESAHMGDVYEGAYVNIAAAAAHDSSEPLFSKREPRFFQPCTVNIPAINGAAYTCCEEEIWHNNVMRTPIYNRGWVVQELILAPRILYFSENQLFWECSEIQACEEWSRGLPKRIVDAEKKIGIPNAGENDTITADLSGNFHLEEFSFQSWEDRGLTRRNAASSNMNDHCDIIEADSKRFQPQSHSVHLHQSDSAVGNGEERFLRSARDNRRGALALVNIDPDDHRQLWPEIVRRYSRSRLSFPERDKLTALSGIAKRLYPSNTHDYIAGFWKDQLPYCLAWRAVGLVERPKQYQAPTWSWASVNGPVWLSSGGMYLPQIRAQTLKVQTYRASLDPTGQVTAGLIRLRTTMIKARCRGLRNTSGFINPDNVGRVIICQVGDSHIRLYPDTQQPKDGDLLHLMCLEASVGTEETEADTIYGLWLSPTRKAGVYRRSGYFEVISHQSSHNAETGNQLRSPFYEGMGPADKDLARAGSFAAFIQLCQTGQYGERTLMKYFPYFRNRIARFDDFEVTGSSEFPSFVVEII